MHRKSIILFLLAVISGAAAAQGKQKKENPFISQVSAGIAEGYTGTSFIADVTGGVRYKNWYVGLGGGLDHYSIRTIPVFLTATRYLSKKSNSFYVQGNAGVNFAWEKENFPAWNQISSRFSPGAYWSSSFGFVTGLDKRNAFLFGLGYSYKFVKETREVAQFCINPPCENGTEIYKYNLRRLNLKLGWQFHYR